MEVAPILPTESARRTKKVKDILINGKSHSMDTRMSRSFSGDRQFGPRNSGPSGGYSSQRKSYNRGNTHYESKELARDLKSVHQGPWKFYFSIALLWMSVVFLGAFLWMKDSNIVNEEEGNWAMLCLLISVVSFGWSCYIFIKEKRVFGSDSEDGTVSESDFWEKDLSDRQLEEQMNKRREEYRNLAAPNRTNDDQLSAESIKQGSEIKPKDVYAKNTKKYEAASRPSSRKPSAATTKATDAKDNLTRAAMKALDDLGVTHEGFKRYYARMRKFIAKSILEKLVAQVNSARSNGLIDSLFTVPGFSHCKEYVRDRVIKLSESQSLSDHKGNGGVKFGDKEWSHNEFPSDNEIVLHIIGTMLSFFMNRGERDRRPDPVFQKKHLSIAREDEEMKDPDPENVGDIILCIRKNWTRFYIVMRDSSDKQIYEAFPGNDGLYWALTLFFLIVKKKKDNALDDADLTGAKGGLCIDYVFSDLHKHY